VCVILQITGGYIGLNDYIISIVGVGGIGICFGCVFLASNAFWRLSKCLEHDKLGISKQQIFFHIGSFLAATVAMVTFLFTSLLGYNTSLG